MQIILSSNIEIIEGNKNNFCWVTPPPPKKNKHKAHASWKCKQINIIHLVVSPNLLGLNHPKSFTHIQYSQTSKIFFLCENCT